MVRPAALLAVLGILVATCLTACGPEGLSPEMVSALREQAQAYGCEYQSAQVVAETVAQSPDRSAPLRLDNLPAAPLLACRYDPHNPELGPAPAIWAGTLTDAVISHDALAVRVLMAQINAAPSATGPCEHPQSRFAILTTFRERDQITEITVELGGCYRAVANTDPHHVRQLDADAVAMLLGPPTVS